MKKIIALLMLLILPTASAGTYILGAHQVSFNVSEPYNSSAKLDPPQYDPQTTEWAYLLNMTPDSQHGIRISVREFSVPDYSRNFIKLFAEAKPQLIKEMGIGGYKSSTMDFKGYPAYQESNPPRGFW